MCVTLIFVFIYLVIIVRRLKMKRTWARASSTQNDNFICSQTEKKGKIKPYNLINKNDG